MATVTDILVICGKAREGEWQYMNFKIVHFVVILAMNAVYLESTTSLSSLRTTWSGARIWLLSVSLCMSIDKLTQTRLRPCRLRLPLLSWVLFLSSSPRRLLLLAPRRLQIVCCLQSLSAGACCVRLLLHSPAISNIRPLAVHQLDHSPQISSRGYKDHHLLFTDLLYISLATLSLILTLTTSFNLRNTW